MQSKTILFHIEPSQKGQYLCIPFEMPENVGEFTLSYEYLHNEYTDTPIEGGKFSSRIRRNTVDLGLVAPGERQIAATGSDKRSITISETYATPGCTPTALIPGTWQIMVGAYRIDPAGADVLYTLKFKAKESRWYTGDLHTHTLASDGSKSLEELCSHAKSQGLDFIAITDHNQFVDPESFPQLDDFTLIPGTEWTHYRGHSNFLGLAKPYDEPFFTNEDDEAASRFRTAHERGALIVINHPHDEDLPFDFDLETFPHHCLEVWNGPMRMSNLQAIAAWQARLASGEKIAAVCGSDYHRDRLFQILGGPSIRVFAASRSAADLLAAVKAGHSYFVYQPESPHLEMHCEGKIMGDSLPWKAGLNLQLKTADLEAGDELRLIGKVSNEVVFKASARGDLSLSLPVKEPGFLRVELWRSLYPGIPSLPLLVSNPIWFD